MIAKNKRKKEIHPEKHLQPFVCFHDTRKKCALLIHVFLVLVVNPKWELRKSKGAASCMSNFVCFSSQHLSTKWLSHVTNVVRLRFKTLNLSFLRFAWKKKFHFSPPNCSQKTTQKHSIELQPLIPCQQHLVYFLRFWSVQYQLSVFACKL